MSINMFINYGAEYDKSKDCIDLSDPEWSIQKEIEFVTERDVKGRWIMVRIYSAPIVETSKGGIFIPPKASDEIAQDQRDLARCGLVVKMGKGAYKDEELYKDTGPYCSVGEWIDFSRLAGTKSIWRGKSYIMIPENAPISGIPDPRELRIA